MMNGAVAISAQWKPGRRGFTECSLPLDSAPAPAKCPENRSILMAWALAMEYHWQCGGREKSIDWSANMYWRTGLGLRLYPKQFKKIMFGSQMTYNRK